MSGFKSRCLDASRGCGERERRRAGGGPRAATEADRSAIESLLGASSLPPPGPGDSLGLFFVHQGDGGSILAAAGLELYGSAGLLRSVVVAGAARRQGIAAALVERVVARARMEGCEALYLLTLDAEGYFRRLGFIAVARDEAPAAIRGSREFVALCPASAVLMRKRLGA